MKWRSWNMKPLGVWTWWHWRRLWEFYGFSLLTDRNRQWQVAAQHDPGLSLACTREGPGMRVECVCARVSEHVWWSLTENGRAGELKSRQSSRGLSNTVVYQTTTHQSHRAMFFKRWVWKGNEIFCQSSWTKDNFNRIQGLDRGCAQCERD